MPPSALCTAHTMAPLIYKTLLTHTQSLDRVYVTEIQSVCVCVRVSQFVCLWVFYIQ